jgi:hypothetical protein
MNTTFKLLFFYTGLYTQCVSYLQVFLSMKYYYDNNFNPSIFVYIVLLLCIVYVASYPSLREVATNDDSNNDLELELRSILNHLNDEQDDDEQMERAVSSG